MRVMRAARSAAVAGGGSGRRLRLGAGWRSPRAAAAPRLTTSTETETQANAATSSTCIAANVTTVPAEPRGGRRGHPANSEDRAQANAANTEDHTWRCRVTL